VEEVLWEYGTEVITVYCAKDCCDCEADQVLLAHGTATPFCQHCIDTTEYIAALCKADLDIWTVPALDYWSDYSEAGYEEHYQLRNAREEIVQ